MSFAGRCSGVFLLTLGVLSGCRIAGPSVGSAIDERDAIPPRVAARPSPDVETSRDLSPADENPFRRPPAVSRTAAKSLVAEHESDEVAESDGRTNRSIAPRRAIEESSASESSAKALSARELRELIDGELPELPRDEREALLRDLRTADPPLARQIVSMHRLIHQVQAGADEATSRDTRREREEEDSPRIATRPRSLGGDRRVAARYEPSWDLSTDEDDGSPSGRPSGRHERRQLMNPDEPPSERAVPARSANGRRLDPVDEPLELHSAKDARRAGPERAPRPTSPVERAAATDASVPRSTLPQPSGIVPVSAQHEAALPGGPAELGRMPMPARSVPAVELQRAIAAAEAELSRMPLGANPTDEERRSFIEKHVSLRMLYWMAGHQDRAMQAIPGIDAADQEFWQKLLWSVSDYFDGKNMPDRGDRATQTSAQLRSAVDRLQETARLELRNVAFCQSIAGYGNYTRFPRNEFARGQRVLLYAEICNFKSVPSTENQYLTQLRSTIEFYNAAGGLVHRIENLNTEDLCANHRRDYYQSYQFNLPGGDKMQIGPHSVKLIVVDELSRKVAEQTVHFTVSP